VTLGQAKTMPLLLADDPLEDPAPAEEEDTSVLICKRPLGLSLVYILSSTLRSEKL
jgi:hypothetical protein